MLSMLPVYKGIIFVITNRRNFKIFRKTQKFCNMLKNKQRITPKGNYGKFSTVNENKIST